MEKMIYHDRAPILLHPEPANQETREWNQYSHWLRGFLNAKTPVNEQARWRTSSMKQAFSTYHTAPAPGTPWHEVASLDYTDLPSPVYCHHCGWEGNEWEVIQAGPDAELCPNCEIRLQFTNE